VLVLDECPRPLAQRVGSLEVAEVHARPRVAMEDAERKVGSGRHRHANAREHVHAVLPPALAGEPLGTRERGASLLSEHRHIGAPDGRQRNDGRSAFHAVCIEGSTREGDPSTD